MTQCRIHPEIYRFVGLCKNTHIKRIEAGTSQPTVEVVKHIALALNVSTDLLFFDQVREDAARRLSDRELIEQFAAVEGFGDRNKQAIKTVLQAMIVKQRVEAAVNSPVG